MERLPVYLTRGVLSVVVAILLAFSLHLVVAGRYPQAVGVAGPAVPLLYLTIRSWRAR